MNNYRVTFLHDLQCNYWNKRAQPEAAHNFPDVHAIYYPIVKEIREAAKALNIKHIWNFYEPYLEITWLSNELEASLLLDKIKKLLEEKNITDGKYYTPEQGSFSEWFCSNEKEREFGAKRYAICADLVALFEEYKMDIKYGKGQREQVKRTIHGVCAQMGLNYMDEAYICFSRGLICLLFKLFSFKKAVWIYTKIFRQKY